MSPFVAELFGTAILILLGDGVVANVVLRQTKGHDSGWIVTPPAMLPAPGPSVAIVRGDTARRPLPLADFEQRVRALAGGAR